MKTKNRLKAFSLFLLSLIILSGCEGDSDTIYLSSPVESEFIASTDKAVLLPEIAQKFILSFSWTRSAIFISDPELKAPEDILMTYLQASTEEDFSSNIIETEVIGFSLAYTVGELNSLAKNLGLVPEVAQDVYFRLRATTGNNLEGTPSKAVKVNVTSYLIDMSVGILLAKGTKEDTGFRLSSPEENGIYTGFMGVSGWYGFYLQEGDGTLWGTDNAGDDAGYPFVLTTESHQWDCWFPGNDGCYYVIMDTPKKEWSALYLPTLEITIDNNKNEMTFDRVNRRWLYSGKANSATTIKIKLNSLDAQQYNYVTGDSDYINSSLAFAQNGEELIIASEPGEINLSVNAAGDYTIIVDLSDPTQWTCIIESGTIEVEEPLAVLYLPGIDSDLKDEAWTFDSYITMYDEDNGKYAGFVTVASNWGYSIHTEKDYWGNKYLYAGGDETSGTLYFTESEDEQSNIPAPVAGTYIIEVATKALTYETAAIGDKIYLEGLNNVWNTYSITLPMSSTPGIYSGEIIITEVSEWGFQILIEPNNWINLYGGADGKLDYKNGNKNIKDDADLGPGTYTMTVDLINNKYTIE